MLEQHEIEHLLAVGELQKQELMGTSPARTSDSETDGEVAATSSPAIAGTSGDASNL